MAEKQELLDELAAGTEALLRALEGVTSADRRPAPDRWSVLEIVEHVAVVEEYLLARLKEAVDGAEPIGSPERERKIRRFAPTRVRPVSALEALVPAGRFATVIEAVNAFHASRAETMRYVESAGDLRAKVAIHPVLGQVNCYEMLLMMAAHPRRHAEQIISG